MALSEKEKLIGKMVHASTAVGILVVREIAAEARSRQPGMTLKQFMTVLDQYETRAKRQMQDDDVIINL